jgi:hypothetical protein
MHTLLEQVPPFWQVVLPHLFLQLVVNSIAPATSTRSAGIISAKRNDLTGQVLD